MTWCKIWEIVTTCEKNQKFLLVIVINPHETVKHSASTSRTGIRGKTHNSRHQGQQFWCLQSWCQRFYYLQWYILSTLISVERKKEQFSNNCFFKVRIKVRLKRKYLGFKVPTSSIYGSERLRWMTDIR